MLFDKIKPKNDGDKPVFNSKDYVSRKEFDKLKRLAETHQNYLNNIFIFYELEPTPFLKGMRELSYELMNFVDNVCSKHDIEYWMDYGTLLGAVRHEDFVPWDDDLDVGIMREDYNKLAEVMQDELDANNLDNLIAGFKIDKHNNKSKRWYQLSYKHPDIKAKFIGVDFFPYDYMADYDGSDITEKYNEFLKFYYHNPDEYSLEEYLDKFYDEFGLAMSSGSHVIGGVDNVRGNLRQYSMYRHFILKSDDIFPLKRMKFGKCSLPAPANPRAYAVNVYGKKYMQIPRKIRDHGRLNKFKKRENIMELLDEGITMLKNANENY